MNNLYMTAIGISAGANGIPTFSADGNLLNNIINLIYVAIGAVALFYIVRGALLFVTGADNPNDIKQAKMTILIAVASFFIASMVFGIVNFVIANVGGTN
jgi:hypothetical protein